MEITVGKNSYLDIEEADTLLNEELFSDDAELIEWKALSNDDKAKILIRGTRKVDTLPFIGYKIKADSEQTLQWPRLIRNNLMDCPIYIKLGMLRQILREKISRSKSENKQMQNLIDMGVKEYKIKDSSISFSDKKVNIMSNEVYLDIYREYFAPWTY